MTYVHTNTLEYRKEENKKKETKSLPTYTYTGDHART